MKYFIIIMSVIIGFAAKAQYPSQQVPTQFSTGWFKQGWPQADSGHILAVRPPSFSPRFAGTTILYQNNGVDTSIHYWTGGRWIKLIPGFDSTSLSNRINLKLNISDTVGKWLAQSTRIVDTMYAVNDSTVGFTIKGNSYTFQILGRSSGGGGGGTGTVTSVGLSLPSAFNVTPSSITTSGIFAVTGAGTTLQYIRGNGTLATTDSGMIPNFYLKVRSLFSGTSPIVYNSTTGGISVPDANNTGTKGVATFNNSDFTDNGAGLISLRNPPGGPAVDTIFRIPGVDSIYFKINGTQHTILDSVGSGGGGGTVTQVNTGYGLTGGPITTIGTALVDTTTLKAVYFPLNLNAGKTIKQNNFNVYFTGGGEVKYDSIKITPSSTFGSSTALFGVGDSYMAGFRPCTPDTIFFDRIRDAYGISGNNYGVSSTGIWRADSIHNYRINPGHTDLSFVWAGFNDIRRGGISNDTTYRKIITGMKAIIANQYLKNWVAGGASGVGVTRYGSWTTTYTCAAVGGKSPNNGAYTNTNNDSIVYLFPSPDTTIIIATINGDGHAAGYNMGTFDIYVDGTLFGHFNGLNADGISDGFYDNARTPNAFIINGLSYAIHTIKLVNTSSNYLVVDYFGHMIDASIGTPLLIAHAPYNNVAGFAVSPNKGSVAAMNKLNNQIDSMVAVTASGWPIFVVPTNSYLDTLTGICTDNIHPNNTGDIQITNAVTSVLMTPNTNISDGTLAFTGSYFKGAANGVTHLIPWLDQTLQKSDTSLFVSNQTSTDKNEGFRITQASALKNKLTVGSSGLSDGSDQMEIITTAGHMRLLGFSSQQYLQSVDISNTTGVGFNFGAGVVNFGQISSGTTTNYVTFDNSASNKMVISGNALINSTVRLGTSLSALNAPITIGMISTFPYQSFNRTASPTNQKIWDYIAENDSVFTWRTVDDAFSSPDTIAYVVRSDIHPLRYVIPHSTLNIGYMNIQGDRLGAYFNRIIGANKDSVILRTTTATRQMLVIDTITGRFERMGISSGGITTLNTLTASTQTFAVGTSGSDFNISSSSSTHTFNIPSASTSNRGLVTTTIQSFAGIKTFTEAVAITDISSKGKLAISGNMSMSSSPGVGGLGLLLSSFTYTDGSTAGTDANGQYFHKIDIPTLAATNARTYSGNTATLFMTGVPIASGSATVSHPFNLFAQDVSRIDVISFKPIETNTDITISGSPTENGSFLVLTGSGGNTWTLPTLATHPGKAYFIKNASSGNLTIQRGGSDNIYDVSSVTSITIAAGTARIFFAGSSFWYVN